MSVLVLALVLILVLASLLAARDRVSRRLQLWQAARGSSVPQGAWSTWPWPYDNAPAWPRCSRASSAAAMSAHSSASLSIAGTHGGMKCMRTHASKLWTQATPTMLAPSHGATLPWSDHIASERWPPRHSCSALSSWPRCSDTSNCTVFQSHAVKQ